MLFQESLVIWTKSQKAIMSRVFRLLVDRANLVKRSGEISFYLPGVLLETEEFPEIFPLNQTESYDEESDDELYPTWSDSECSDIEMDSDMDSDMETESVTVEPRQFGRPKKVLTKEDIEKDDQTLKLVS